MDGLYHGTGSSEALQQAALTRHRLLTVNCGSRTNVAWNTCDASGMASLDPNAITAGTRNSASPRGVEGGPHFILGKDTPDGAKTFGFEWCVFTNGLQAAELAAPAVAGYSVTVWALISNTQSVNGLAVPVWASFLTLTGVGVRELYHTFDVNATAIRFQFGAAGLLLDPTTNSRSLVIALAEL